MSDGAPEKPLPSDASSEDLGDLDEKYEDIDGREGDKETMLEKHWRLLRDYLQFARIQEDEDALTDMYVDLLGPRGTTACDGTALHVPKGHDEEEKILPVWEYKNGTPWMRHQSRFLSTPMKLVQKDPDVMPQLPDTSDKYTLCTWFFLRSRALVEEREIAKRGIRIFMNAVLQLFVCATVWGLGSTELDGGRVEVVVASFAVGVVGIISQTFGLLGSLSENESFLRKYWLAQLWMLSLLTTFLYTELHHIQDNNKLCNPSSADYTQNAQYREDGSCAKNQAIITAGIIMNLIELFLSFLAIYNTTGMLDSINDKTSIDDNIHVFKYFQIYSHELSERLLSSCGEMLKSSE